MDILVGDFHGGKAHGGGAFDQVLVDPLATWIRSSAFFLTNVTFVKMDGIHSFVNGVLGRAGGSKVENLYILDHAYGVAGGTYEGGTPDQQPARGGEWNVVQVEFGSTTLSHQNLGGWEATLKRLRPVLGGGSHVVFMNCLVGRDAALLTKLATIWGCPVSGPTTVQSAGEIINILNPRDALWTTATPDKKVRQSVSHPIWG